MPITELGLNDILPGFCMGFVRSIISHPFEMMKLKTQTQTDLGNTFYKNLYRGVHYSIVTTSFERGVQFGLFEKLKKDNSTFMSSVKSSGCSTLMGVPYTIVLIKKTLMKTSVYVPKDVFAKSLFLEYNRNLCGSTLFLYFYNTFKDNQVPLIINAPLTSTIVWGITFPIDTVKNQIISGRPIKWTGSNLYRGIQYPIIRSVPSSIIGFAVYEKVSEMINRNNLKS